MKTKKVIILVGLLLSSQLTLIACQSRGNGTYPIKTKQSCKGMTSNKIKPIKKKQKRQTRLTKVWRVSIFLQMMGLF